MSRVEPTSGMLRNAYVRQGFTAGAVVGFGLGLVVLLRALIGQSHDSLAGLALLLIGPLVCGALGALTGLLGWVWQGRREGPVPVGTLLVVGYVLSALAFGLLSEFRVGGPLAYALLLVPCAAGALLTRHLVDRYLASL